MHLSATYKSAASTHQQDSLDDGRHYRRSIGYVSKRQRPLADSTSNASSRGHGESSHAFSYDEATLRQLLLEYVNPLHTPKKKHFFLPRFRF